MSIPFLDLHSSTASLRPELDEAIARVLSSGRYLLGPELEAFEGEWASFVGAKHCVGLASGLDALTLGLVSMEVGPGDEVVVPAHTFIATWLAVSRVGAIPVPVEPQPGSYNIDPSGVEAAITPRTKAIIPVHLYGLPAAMDELGRVAAQAGIPILEDAAQAHGARYRGQTIGGLGHTAAWSFYPAKNLGALGDAGALTTDDPSLAQRVRRLRNYGSAEKYSHLEQGFNSRMDELQAAALRVKLRHLDEWNAHRTRVAQCYFESLNGAELILPPMVPNLDSSWHLFVVRSLRRGEVQSALKSAGIGTLVHYPIPPHLQAAYSEHGFSAGMFPTTERICQEVVSLPMSPHLPLDDVARVVVELRNLEAR